MILMSLSFSAARRLTFFHGNRLCWHIHIYIFIYLLCYSVNFFFFCKWCRLLLYVLFLQHLHIPVKLIYILFKMWSWTISFAVVFYLLQDSLCYREMWDFRMFQQVKYKSKPILSLSLLVMGERLSLTIKTSHHYEKRKELECVLHLSAILLAGYTWFYTTVVLLKYYLICSSELRTKIHVKYLIMQKRSETFNIKLKLNMCI